MNTMILIARAATISAMATLFSAPVQAALITYDIDIPTVGSGWFEYDDSAINDDGGGNYSSPLTDFSFVFNGFTYSLSNSAGGHFALFIDPGTGIDFVGIQYLSAGTTDTIEFVGALSANGSDRGNLYINGGAPLALDNTNFILNIPEPDTWACILIGGFGLGSLTRARRGGRSGSY